MRISTTVTRAPTFGCPEQIGLQEKLDYLKQHRLNLLYERKSK
jgi:hypothetical protein